ncbi:deoxyribose-phosphate aldolase [Aromatoleum bremense]|uniref:Deoxyribose-phosphate aldolase n=1 Tax=Aromatoleum bremense TaxID=76115 RepID=A0ABX1NV30_9RHOO|nr:deoxyribose-phosphate aldolase [Aromatoleum bremense]NMG15410.1 deoxyribose-phosphate aldolase [Aromatoleum bremense]QTQ34053.1 Deoxyribose-phosphate aldolase [Aromatoleum bremense]
MEPALSRPELARLALSCLDLTSLRADDTDAGIEALAAQAMTPHGVPAALCVYPRFVPAAKRALARRGATGVRVATVVNFPHGTAEADAVADEVRQAIAYGADEIDAVLPWRALLAGDAPRAMRVLRRCRQACDAGGAPVLLKAILETGELREPRWIRTAAELAIEAGADFLKTSTGKVPINATPEAVACMLEVIRAGEGQVGLKVSGGVVTIEDVECYAALAARACGAAWLSPRHLRFGASSLLPVLLAVLDGAPTSARRGPTR